MREMSAATYDGVFVWKISDFTKKRQDAVAGRAPAMFSPGKHSVQTCSHQVVLAWNNHDLTLGCLTSSSSILYE